MKNLSALALLLVLVNFLQAQSLIGAWESTDISEEGDTIKSVVIFSESHQVATWFNATSGKFITTNGGGWKLDGTTMTETVEFDQSNPERVGSNITFEIELTNNTLKIVGMNQVWERIDDGRPGNLQGAWLMSGRVKDGETRFRDTSKPRKTMKILSGTRFQWIAYNTETKEFKGTGGGTYTTTSGKYTENIEFFSSDDTRVGASLEFDFELVDGTWHHKGFSSKGDPMHEVWSMR